MTVTDISKTKKGRYALFADGEFLFSIHKDSFFRTKLAVGNVMTAEELEELRLEDEFISAKETALNILSRAAQSSGILREKLARYYGEEAVERTLARMAELGLLDDRDYATRFASDCVKLRGYSMQRLRQALWQKKLPPEAIEAGMAQFEDRDEIEPIIAILLKKYRAQIFDAEGLRKTIAAMQRRGFSYGNIKAALDRIEEEELYLE